jgi:hypothetical protein
MTLDPKREQERLDELQEDIDEARNDLAEELGENERAFIEPGKAGPVDNTIVPPG